MGGVYEINPRKKSFFSLLSINSILIFINVLAFIVFTTLISQIPGFIDYVAIKPFNILAGKYTWTFLTSMFMHAGFFHIIVNMFSLFFVGNLVEKILGRKRYLLFYLASGIFAGLLFVFSAFLLPSELNTYAVGASGALFGIIGLLMVLTPNLPVYLMLIPIPVKMKYAAPGMLVVLWFISIAGNVPIGNTAHLGGFLVGIAYGLYLRSRYKKKIQYISKYFS